MAEEAPETVGTGPALGKDFGEHVIDVGKTKEVMALVRFKEGAAYKMPLLTDPSYGRCRDVLRRTGTVCNYHEMQ